MKNTTVHIRLSELNDLTEITDIYNSMIMEGRITADLDTFTVEERTSWYAEHSRFPYETFILESNTDVLGYFYFSPWRKGRAALKGVAEISFFLAKEARGMGLGDLIMESSIKLAQERGFTHLLAILMDLNMKSRGLLDKWGFKMVGELTGVVDLPDVRAGQLIMLKKLI